MLYADPFDVPSLIQESMSQLAPENRVSVALEQLLQKAEQASETNKFRVNPAFDAMQEWRANYAEFMSGHNEQPNSTLTQFVNCVTRIIDPYTEDGRRKDCRAINHHLYDFTVTHKDAIKDALTAWKSTKTVQNQNNL